MVLCSTSIASVSNLTKELDNWLLDAFSINVTSNTSNTKNHFRPKSDKNSKENFLSDSDDYWTNVLSGVLFEETKESERTLSRDHKHRINCNSKDKLDQRKNCISAITNYDSEMETASVVESSNLLFSRDSSWLIIINENSKVERNNSSEAASKDKTVMWMSRKSGKEVS